MFRKSLLLIATFCLTIALSVQAPAQSIISGDITGSITDPSGAGIPGATVTLTNVSTNAPQRTTTNADGSYRFAFVPPGTYQVSGSASGFQSQTRSGVVVTAGQPSTVSMQLAIAGASQTVTVEAAESLVQIQNADVATNYSGGMIENLPNPGGDITYFAQTAPGVVMNTDGGNGNFSAQGMPGTSNLFTINGMNNNDPFLNVNNSGASNLMLGSNDISEANIINNAYSGQYGQYAGSQVAYITKSGTNAFHGNAVYNWNGRALNANQFFSNQVGQPTPFNNFNQWAAAANGPIIRNRTFFDADYEGLRNLLPGGSTLTLIPSPQFQSATLANLAVKGNAAEIPFYQQLFKVYNGAPGAGSATPVTSDGDGGCGGLSFAGLGAGVPCALQFRSTPPDINKEYLWSARVDHHFSEKDSGNIRVLRDNGFQPTYASPFGPTFNLQSNQPQMQGQVSETHVFGPNTVNQLNGSVLFYAAVFVPSDPNGALAAFPTYIGFSGNSFSSTGAWGEPPFPPGFFFPQGRRVFQYQVADDFSHVVGKHTFRVGFSWVHDSVTDLDFNALGGPINGALTTNLSDFFNGGGAKSSLDQAFPSSAEEGLKFNTFGGYVADDWKLNDRLTVSLNLRLESYKNPTCDSNCFSHLTTPFTGAPDPTATSTPYNQFIISDQHTGYPNTQTVVWEPRIGIAWRPSNSDKTVIRAGAGVFADALPGGLAEVAAFNVPNLNAFIIPNGTLAPGVPGSLFTTAAQANQALLSAFHSGGSFNSISQAVPGFVPPNFDSFPSNFKQPTYYKWNFQVERAIGTRTLLSVNYAGMRGLHIPVGDGGLNAYCPPSVCPNGFAGLPAAPANAAFGTILQYLSAGGSNYNGLIVSLQRRISSGLTFNLNYTWSHALDDVSNGGVTNGQFGLFQTNPNIQFPQNPFNIRSNYASADYDVRHYFSANFVLSDMFRHVGFKYGPNWILGGWTLSSNWFWRSGLPYTIIDTSGNSTLAGYNYAGTTFASPAGSVPKTCTNAVNSPCMSTSQFQPSAAATGFPTGFGTIGRNSVYGPHFFDVDVALMKDVRITERLTFSFGAQAYNVFNHPNFDQAVSDISNPLFGSSTALVAPPTSLLGAFVPGTAASPRFVEIKGVLRF
ncbi:MAG: carboxypeptidase regulatory-like domain-containing protein [Acidobacteriaceae bacterium]|nr:carboxypeptidase regulatory-like domain-containing protein [Acidobacteriaceae bacterium]